MFAEHLHFGPNKYVVVDDFMVWKSSHFYDPVLPSLDSRELGSSGYDLRWWCLYTRRTYFITLGKLFKVHTLSTPFLPSDQCWNSTDMSWFRGVS